MATKPKIASSMNGRLQDTAPKVRKVDPLPRHSAGIKVWLIHRIAGVGLLIYLMAHIATMGTAMFLGDAAFEKTFDVLFHTPIFIFFDVLVLAALILHALNGARLIIMELGFWMTKRKHKTGLLITFGLAAALFAWLFSRAFL